MMHERLGQSSFSSPLRSAPAVGEVDDKIDISNIVYSEEKEFYF